MFMISDLTSSRDFMNIFVSPSDMPARSSSVERVDSSMSWHSIRLKFDVTRKYQKEGTMMGTGDSEEGYS